MLEPISWQAFFTTIAIILGGYYAIATLLLYRTEIGNFFKPRNPGQSNIETSPHKSAPIESNDIMGGVRHVDNRRHPALRVELTNSDDLTIARSREDEEPVSVIDPVEEILKTDFNTIQTEINALGEIAAQSTREESASLFKTLLSNYPQFVGTAFQPKISQVIHDACRRDSAHQFSVHEIDTWWVTTGTNSQTP